MTKRLTIVDLIGGHVDQETWDRAQAAETEQLLAIASEYQEVRVDAVGQPSLYGLDQETGDTAKEILQLYAREVGQIAMREGNGRLLMLGMLDAGMTTETILETLEMHGQFGEEGADTIQVLADGEIVTSI